MNGVISRAMAKMKMSSVILLGILLILGISACGRSKEEQWQAKYDMGVRYLSEGNYEEAIIAFTAAIEIDPKQAPAYVSRGDAYIGSGETEENLAAALADYEMAIELDETNAQAYLGLADVYIRRGDYDKALEVLQKGLEKTGNDQAIADKLAEMELGKIKDSSGRIRQECTYDSNSNLIYTHTYDYDEQGRKTAVTSYNSTGVQTGHVDIRYDTEGNRLNDYHWGDDGAVGRIDHEYDESGNRIKSVNFSLDGEVTNYYLYQYDANGLEIQESCYNNDGILRQYRISEYDAVGNEIKYSNYGADGTLWGYFLMEYDGAGHRVKYSYYSEDGTLNWFWVDRYDEQGNYLGQEEYDAEGNLTQSTVVDK